MIIGLTGKKNSGKSTASKYLVDHYNFIELSFAEPLKLACMSIFGLKREQVFGNQADKETIDAFWKTSPRQMMQQLGTAVRAFEQPLNDVWICNVRNQIEKIIRSNPNANVVVSDVRYADEAKMLTELGGSVIQISRPDECFDAHESEHQHVPTKWSVLNNGTCTDLYRTIDVVVFAQLSQ